MAIEGIHTPFAAGLNAATGAHATDGPRGLFMGHAVKVEATPEKLLADAAEEIGFALDKTQDYEISRRKERNASRISEELLARYRAHFEKAGKSEAMHSTVESLKHAADAKRFRETLEEAFPDPADAWAVLEAARVKHFLKEGGILLVNDERILPLPCITGAVEYPSGLKEKLLEQINRAYFVNAKAMAHEAGGEKATNIVMLGCMCRLFDFDKDVMRQAIIECVPERFRDLNLRAFEIGYEKVK